MTRYARRWQYNCSPPPLFTVVSYQKNKIERIAYISFNQEPTVAEIIEVSDLLVLGATTTVTTTDMQIYTQ